jgi:pre-mRNA-processing factor 8
MTLLFPACVVAARARQGYAPTHYEKVQMLLSDRFLGFYMIPEQVLLSCSTVHVMHGGPLYNPHFVKPRQSGA